MYYKEKGKTTQKDERPSNILFIFGPYIQVPMYLCVCTQFLSVQFTQALASFQETRIMSVSLGPVWLLACSKYKNYFTQYNVSLLLFVCLFFRILMLYACPRLETSFTTNTTISASSPDGADEQKVRFFSNFSCTFLNPDDFFPI